MTNRKEVYVAIDTERDYQESRWDNNDKEGNTPSAWLLWMHDYLNQAIHLASTTSEAEGTETKKDIMSAIRKVTALGVAAMEVNGAPQRKI